MKKVRLGYWVLVDFSSDAQNFGTADDFNKKIYHYIDGFIIKDESYSSFKIEDYKKAGIPVIDKTLGKEVPDETKFVSPFQSVLGAISIVMER